MYRQSRYRFGRTLLPAKALAQMEGFCEMQVHLLFSHYGGGARLLAQDEVVEKGTLLHGKGMSKTISVGRAAASYSRSKLVLVVGLVTTVLAIILILAITGESMSWW
jgi:hypothetical protein